jgi:ABC-type multidrug transport system permease subunit
MLAVALALAARLIILVRRSPAVFIPSLVIPLFILISTAGAFHGVGNLPQLEGASYLAFTVPMAATLGAGFAGTTAGMSMARDLEGGFFARLQASPAPRPSLVVAPVLAAMLRSLLTTTIVFAAALIGGIGLPSAGGAGILYLMPILFAACAAMWAAGVALRAKTIQSAPIMQIAVFLSVFLSVAYTPRDAQTGWLATVADYNPMTYVLEGARDSFLNGVSWSELWPGLLAAAGMIAVLGMWAGTGLRRHERS